MSNRSGLFSLIWKRLTKKSVSYREKIVGQDAFGNTFYESNELNYKGQPARFHNPPANCDVIGNKMSPEWDAWLRFRRKDPPGQSEIVHNIQISEMRKAKAAQKLEEIKANYPDYAERLRELNVKKADRESVNQFSKEFPIRPDTEEFPGLGKKR